MTSPSAYPELFATYQRAKADAAHKFGLIVAPPRGGKTILLKQIARSIRLNHPVDTG